MKHLFGLAFSESHELARAEMHSMAARLQEMLAHAMNDRMPEDVGDACGFTGQPMETLRSAAEEFIAEFLRRIGIAPIDGIEMGRHVIRELVDDFGRQEIVHDCAAVLIDRRDDFGDRRRSRKGRELLGHGSFLSGIQSRARSLAEPVSKIRREEGA